MRTELGGTASQGDANAQEPTIGRNGTEASSDLTSQASADGVGPAENGEDDDSMEAVDEDSARVRTQNVTAEQDDEIDELMEELDQPEDGKKPPKVRGEDGKGELEEEVEGEVSCEDFVYNPGNEALTLNHLPPAPHAGRRRSTEEEAFSRSFSTPAALNLRDASLPNTVAVTCFRWKSSCGLPSLDG